MITVHHLENSRSQRILWLLEELGVPYEIVRYARDPQTMLAPASLLAVHPLGKSPVVTDDGQTLAETGAIIETLLDRHDLQHTLSPPGAEGRAAMRYWLHFAEGSAMTPMLISLIFNRIPGRVPFFIRPAAKLIAKGTQAQFVAPNLKRQREFMEASLGATGWFAGDAFSAADIMMSFPVETQAASVGLEGLPNLTAWLKKIHARPAYQRALERGGPYAYA